MADIENIMQLERHLEDAFEKVLKAAGATVFRSRGVSLTASPRVEIVAEVGNVLNHTYNFRDGIRWAYDAWKGSLTAMIVTNRTQTESRTSAHQRLLGLVRAALQQFRLAGSDNKVGAAWPGVIVFLTDIREAGTLQRFEDEDDLDYSEVRWDLIFNVNPAMWEDYSILIDADGTVIVADETGTPIQL